MTLHQLKIWLHTQIRRATFGQWVPVLDMPLKLKPDETDEAIRLLRETGIELQRL